MILLFGTLFAIAFTFAIGLLCGGAWWFVDIASLIIVVFPLAFFLLVTNTGRTIGGYVKTSFMKSHEYSKAELLSISSAAKNGEKLTLAAGFFGFLSGLIALLTNLDNLPQVGVNVSVALLSLYYAVAIAYFIFFPLQVWAKNKAALVL